VNPAAPIYVAGHQGMVGHALLRALTARGYSNFVLRSRVELDLRDQAAVRRLFAAERPVYVFLAAARVGGILANSREPAGFLADNLAIALNVIQAAHEFQVAKLLNLGSSCIYPRLAPQPLREEYLLTGPLEPTNEAYAIAKIAAIKLCDGYRHESGANFLSLMPTNLYGPDDNFDLETSHVLPALIRRCHEAKVRGARRVTLWGSGNPRREFLHVDDLADACCFVMDRYDGEGFLNVGTGVDLTIREAAALVAEVVGYEGEFEFDASKPDGTPRKLLDVSRLAALGWRARIGLRDGIADTYRWYREHLGGD
jgi:GDP-L-fucose synthase